MEDVIAVSGLVLIAIVWIALHYMTKWRAAPKITDQDEKLLDEMFNLARRLEERVQTVERIAAADHPDWRPGLSAPGTDRKPGLTGPTPTPSYRIDRSN